MKDGQAIGCGDSRYTVGCWVRQRRLKYWPTAKIPASSFTVHTTSTLAPRGPSTAALESQHLASAVRPLLQHFQSSTPADWAAGEFALDPEFGWWM
jgi:hypothetical protein